MTPTNAEYHSDLSAQSSSMLKLLLKDPSQYYVEYILGQGLKKEANYFTEGSFVHSLILEPETITSRYAVYPGLVKRGKAWDEFKVANAGKELLSAAQVLKCERMAKAFQALPAALGLLKDCLVEHTLYGEIMGIRVKCRADAINVNTGYVTDVKTTSSPSDVEFFKHAIKDYSYQLSAALYCEIARQNYNKPFAFYWKVLSNADQGCEVYKASEATLAEGTALYTQALLLYKHCLNTGKWVPKPKLSLVTQTDYEIMEI